MKIDGFFIIHLTLANNATRAYLVWAESKLAVNKFAEGEIQIGFSIAGRKILTDMFILTEIFLWRQKLPI